MKYYNFVILITKITLLFLFSYLSYASVDMTKNNTYKHGNQGGIFVNTDNIKKISQQMNPTKIPSPTQQTYPHNNNEIRNYNYQNKPLKETQEEKIKFSEMSKRYFK